MPFFDEMFKNGLNLEKFSHGKSQRSSTIDMLALSQKMIHVQLNYKHNISRKKLATQHLLRLNGSIRYKEWEIESSYTAHEENSTSFVQFDVLVASIWHRLLWPIELRPAATVATGSYQSFECSSSMDGSSIKQWQAHGREELWQIATKKPDRFKCFCGSVVLLSRLLSFSFTILRFRICVVYSSIEVLFMSRHGWWRLTCVCLCECLCLCVYVSVVSGIMFVWEIVPLGWRPFDLYPRCL